MSRRETRFLDAVGSLVDGLLDDFDIVDLLTELAEHCAQLLDVGPAGFLLADPLRQLHLIAATSEKARDLELFPLQADHADLLVGQTLTHIACVAILHELAPAPVTVLPHLRTVLTSRVFLEQAKGFLRER